MTGLPPLAINECPVGARVTVHRGLSPSVYAFIIQGVAKRHEQLSPSRRGRGQGENTCAAYSSSRAPMTTVWSGGRRK